jgi:hypothetical protein
VIHLRPIGGSGGQRSFNGESQFFTDDFPGFAGSVNIGTCKYVYQRVAQSRPVVPTCRGRRSGRNERRWPLAAGT